MCIRDRGTDAAGPPRRVRLPGYAFERRRHWIDAPGARTGSGAPEPEQVVDSGGGRMPRPLLTTEHVAPRTDRERAVTEVWEEQLAVEGIGVHDNFFDLGGDSMRAVLLAGRLRSAGVLDVPAASLLASPTVAGLLASVDDLRGSSPEAVRPLLPLRREGGQTPLFCVHPAAGVSWRYTGLLPHLGPDQPVFGIQALGLDGTCPPAPDAKSMVASYVDLVREAQPEGPYRLLGWSYGGCVAHAMACALQEQGERVELLAMLDAPQPHGTLHDPQRAERQVAALLMRVDVYKRQRSGAHQRGPGRRYRGDGSGDARRGRGDRRRDAQQPADLTAVQSRRLPRRGAVLQRNRGRVRRRRRSRVRSP